MSNRSWRAGHGEWLGLLAILPILMFPRPATAPLLMLVPLSFAWRRWRRRSFFQRTPLDLSLLLLTTMMLVSLAATFDMNLSFPKIAGLAMGVALFYAVQEIGRARGSAWPVAVVIVMSGVAMGLVGVIGGRWSGWLAPLNGLRGLLPASWQRIPGTSLGVVNPNELAGTLIWVAPLAVGMLWAVRRRWDSGWRWRFTWVLALGAALFCTAVVLISGSRAGVLSLAAAFALMAAMRFPRWRLAIAALVVVAVVLLWTVGRGLWLGTIVDADWVALPLSLEGRLEIWSRALYGLQDFPLTGMSMNGFRRVVHVLYPLFVIPPHVDLGHAHNHLLQAGLDLGLPGLVAYLALWIGAAALLHQSWRQSDGSGRHLRPLVLGLAGSLVAGWLFGIVDAIALGARPGFVFWLLLGLVALAHRQSTLAEVVETGTPRTRPAAPADQVSDNDHTGRTSPVG